ncbi:MAG: sulfotransferase domain-containing protein [Pleurocapsa sp.]
MTGVQIMPFSSPFIESLIEINRHQNWIKENTQLFHTPYLFLSSFPRSGNGWIRLVLAAIVLETKGIDINQVEIIRKATKGGVKYICFVLGEKEYDLEDIFPDMYILNPQEVNLTNKSEDVKRLNLPIILIKTHHIVDCSTHKTIFLFREPLNCLTSSALLLNSEAIANNPATINETMIYFAKFYRQMLEHYLEQKEKYPQNCFLLSHQKIKSDRSFSELAKVIDFIGIKVEIDTIKKVLHKFPFRSGYNKKIAEAMTDSTEEYIDRLLTAKYERAITMSDQQ